jgi:L-lactate dehydrogenase
MHIFSVLGVGEVGSLISAKIISEFSGIQLNLVDPRKDISGKILDLSHAAAAQNNELRFNDLDLLRESDYIIFTAGFSNSRAVDRNSVLAQNKALVESIFKDLQLKASVKIIVVTNPVDLISQIIYEFLEHKYTVLGTGTSLDSYRLQYLLAKKFELSPALVSALVLGEHGSDMLPVYSKSYIKGKVASDLLSAQEQIEISTALKQSATEIRKTEDATKYGVSMAVLQILKALEGDTDPLRLPLSYPLIAEYAEKLELKEGLFVSYSLELMKDMILTTPFPRLLPKELADFQKAGQKLQDLYQKVSKQS